MTMETKEYEYLKLILADVLYKSINDTPKKAVEILSVKLFVVLYNMSFA